MCKSAAKNRHCWHLTIHQGYWTLPQYLDYAHFTSTKLQYLSCEPYIYIYKVFTTKKKSGSTDENIGRKTELPEQLTYMAYIEDSPSFEDELAPYIR